jgi:putative membrane protein
MDSLLLRTLLHLAVLTAAVLGIARFLPGVEVKDTKSAIIVAVVFSVLNLLLGWLLKALLFVPALLTLGLLFFFIPFIINAVLLWLTDKLIDTFELKTPRALFVSAGVITVVNWLFQAVTHTKHLPHG